MGITKYLQSMRLFWGSAEADLITSLIKSSDDINGIFWHQGLRILLLNDTYILSGYQKLGWSPMHLLELVFYYQASVIINLPLETPGSLFKSLLEKTSFPPSVFFWIFCLWGYSRTAPWVIPLLQIKSNSNVNRAYILAGLAMM